jgi:molecular chaperone DnaK
MEKSYSPGKSDREIQMNSAEGRLVASAIGIDLGTTSACAAQLSGQDIQFLCPIPEGIPAILALDEDGTLLVGTPAKKRLREFPASGLSGTKRLLGKKANTVVDQVRQLFTYELEAGEDDSLLLRIQDEVLTLEQITAAILGEVKRVAETHLQREVNEAVITVPAYFNQKQREAVRSAAKLAGLKVLSLLNEPTAAALAYGQGKGLQERVAVFDLGGGTLDIAVVDIKDNVFDVVAAGGDTFLGGVDFDESIAQWALSRFLEKYPAETVGPFALARIRNVAEEAKIALSQTETVKLFVPALAGNKNNGLDLHEELRRDQLEDLTQALVDQSLTRLHQVLDLTSGPPLSKLLIIGGQSQMPLLKKALLNAVGLDLEAQADPRTSVAAGAAIYAATLSGNTKLVLSERLPLGVGIALPDGSTHTLFPAGEPLPAQCSRQFTTHQDKQTEVILDLVQGQANKDGERDALGTLRLNGLKEAAAGEVQLSVRFRMDEEGRLNIRAINPTTGERVEAHLNTAAPPPLKGLQLPGLADLQSTLKEEEEEAQAAKATTKNSTVDPEETQAPLATPALPAIQMPTLPPLLPPVTASSPNIEASSAPDATTPPKPPTPMVRLGNNRPYPFYLSFRDWIQDFLGGLFGR